MEHLEKGKSKIVNMTEGSIAKGIIAFAVPMILSDFLQQLYNATDSIIVGRMVGTTALAAVGETFFIIYLFLGMFLGLSIGATVAISRYYGAKNFHRLGQAVDVTLKITDILCIAFTIISILLIDPLLKLVGTQADTYEEARIYLVIYFAGISTQLVYNILSAILKSIGDSRRPLYVLAITAVLNIGLDLIFIGPFEMGVAGAAYATVIAQAVSCIVLWRMMQKTPVFEKPLIKKEPLDKETFKFILKVGLPDAIQRTINSLSNIITMSFVNYFGSTAMAAWSAYQKVNVFIFSTIMSISAAITTYVSQNIGANRKDRIKKGVLIGNALTLGVTIVYGLLALRFRVEVISLFDTDIDVIECGIYILSTMVLMQIADGFAVLYAGALRGFGRSIEPTTIMLIAYVVLRQVYLHVIWPYQQSLLIVMRSYYWTWALCAAAMVIIYIFVAKKEIGIKNTKQRIK